jgi:AraC family transcriptional regulator of adaptative response / DNA-3-methyladenine glycosylase II
VDGEGTLTHLFPAPEALPDVDALLPADRRRTLRALSEALCRGLDLGPGSDRDEALCVLGELPGIGPWTAQTIAMRALGDPDAFPVSDLGVRRGATAIGLPATPAALVGRASHWRPWRAYAVQHLWAVNDHPINRWPSPSRSRPQTDTDAETEGAP